MQPIKSLRTPKQRRKSRRAAARILFDRADPDAASDEIVARARRAAMAAAFGGGVTDGQNPNTILYKVRQQATEDDRAAAAVRDRELRANIAAGREELRYMDKDGVWRKLNDRHKDKDGVWRKSAPQTEDEQAAAVQADLWFKNEQEIQELKQREAEARRASALLAAASGAARAVTKARAPAAPSRRSSSATAWAARRAAAAQWRSQQSPPAQSGVTFAAADNLTKFYPAVDTRTDRGKRHREKFQIDNAWVWHWDEEGGYWDNHITGTMQRGQPVMLVKTPVDQYNAASAAQSRDPDWRHPWAGHGKGGGKKRRRRQRTRRRRRTRRRKRGGQRRKKTRRKRKRRR
jgi:hypothetical protein